MSKLRKGRAGQKRQGPWEPSPEQLAVYADRSRGDKTLAAIGEKHGVSAAQVCRTCSKIDKWLVPQFIDEIRQTKVRHTAHLYHVFQQAMEAWEESKKPGVVERDETGGKWGGKTVKETRYQCGDSRYLAEARTALKQIREIWGADAPIDVRYQGEFRVAGIPREEAAKQLMTRLQGMLQPAKN